MEVILQVLGVLWGLVQTYWTALIVPALPFAVALIARSSWTADAKRNTAGVVSILWGVLAAGVAHKLTLNLGDLATVLVMVAAVRGGVQFAYEVFSRWSITCPWLEWLLEVGSHARQ